MTEHDAAGEQAVDGNAEAEAWVESVAADVGEANDAELLRALILQAHPDVVPELVRGGSLREMLDSVGEARAAYARIATTVATTPPSIEPVPAGSGVRSASVNVEGLSPMGKIRLGVGAARSG